MNIKTDWHNRFSTQLKWTIPLRDVIYSDLNITSSSTILEPGCGTGALLIELGKRFHCDLHGLDIDAHRLSLAKRNLTENHIPAILKKANVVKTGYKNESFDFIFTHYLFLWVDDLQSAFNELHRILKPEGKLIILAEPDYGGLIEKPDSNLKNALQSNLRKQGSNPNVGREIPQYWKNQFEIETPYTSSIPWLPINRKSQLLQEAKFLETILQDENFEANTMKNAIKMENYFLYIPVFTYVLKKVQKSE
ncbi:MAG: class I SAM-dependent methyltransferase [Promethearchaeota archaeon]